MPNPCQNRGSCVDMWNVYECQCPRPYLGKECRESFQAGTFGHENTTTSLVTVTVPEMLKNALASDEMEVSFFLRTREADGSVLRAVEVYLNYNV